VARSATVLILISIQLVWAALAVAAPDRARMEDPFEITADEIHYDNPRNLYVAERNVRVEQGARRLRARWIAFSTETRLGVAEGNVELIEDGNHLIAEFMIFNVDTLQGTLYQGELDAGRDGFHIQAQELIRTGDDTFAMRDGVFTTCRCEEGERVPWTLSAADARVEMGGYGTLTNSTFDVLGVPVLWIPWIFFPMKSERETGFLLPDFEFGGRGGFGVGLPFFWAVHPQLNVTLTPRYYSQRGYKQDVELEYVFGKRSEGELFVAGLRDSQGRDQTRKDRWAVLWDHDQFLPAKWRWQTDLNLISDNLYVDDFNEMRDYKSFRYIESTTNVERDFGVGGGYGAMVGARYADDIQGSTFDDRDDYMLQRATELRGDVQPGTVQGPLGIEARMDSQFIYFAGFNKPENNLDPRLSTSRALHTNGRFLDLGFDGQQARFIPGPPPNFIAANGEDDGIFQPGEPLAERGARVILHPRLSRSFQVGNLLEVVPEVGWQQTLYRSSDHQFAERGLLTARTDFRTRLVRDYVGDKGSVTRHVIEPKLSWALVSQRRQRQNPLFVPRGDVVQTRLRTLSLENVTRDPSDRTKSANIVALGVGQRFFSAAGPSSVPRIRGDLVTAIDWDFADSGGLGEIVAEGRMFPIGPLAGRVRAAFDPEAVAFEEGGVEFALTTQNETSFFRRTSFLGGYRYLRRPPRFFETDIGDSSAFDRQGDSQVNQVDFRFRVELAWRIRLTYSAIYGLTQEAQGFIRNRGMIEYVSKCRCWGIGLQLDHEKRDGIQAGLMIRFLGLGDERSNLFDSGLGTGMSL
jgi:lipopolysaccharide export system protein LptA